MSILPKVKNETLLGGQVTFRRVRWQMEAGPRLWNAARSLLPEAEDGYPVRVLHQDLPEDAYRLKLLPEGAEIYSSGETGAFYAMQSLAMLRSQGSGTVACREIADAPDLSFRGFMLDVTRGRVPTMDNLKSIIRQLARYKINKLQIYIENAFLFEQMKGIAAEGNYLTPEEFRQLDDWCYENYIELIPTFACFGHLYDLLQDPRYRHLAELESYSPEYHYWPEKMLHHTLDVSNPESIALVQDMLDQVLPLFRSDTVNICCDETFDLCKGRNQGMDPAQAYFGFVRQICGFVQSRGKRVQMWADIALKYPESIRELGTDVTFLNWDYTAQPEETGAKQLAEGGFPQILCPGVQSWNVWVPNIPNAEKNITAMAGFARKYHAQGLLNTAWGDYGHVCPWNGSVYGMVVGAEKSWNCTEELPDEAFRRTVSRMEFGVDMDLYAILGEINARDRLMWRVLVYAMTDAELEPWERECGAEENLQAIIEDCRKAEKALAAFPMAPAVNDLLLGVQGTRFTAQMLCRILHGTGAVDTYEMRQWLPLYKKRWLKENRPSELWRLEQFLMDAVRKAR